MSLLDDWEAKGLRKVARTTLIWLMFCGFVIDELVAQQKERWRSKVPAVPPFGQEPTST